MEPAPGADYSTNVPEEAGLEVPNIFFTVDLMRFWD